MSREMHIEKHTSLKAPRQPTLAVPLLQTFVASYTENQAYQKLLVLQ